MDNTQSAPVHRSAIPAAPAAILLQPVHLSAPALHAPVVPMRRIQAAAHAPHALSLANTHSRELRFARIAPREDIPPIMISRLVSSV